MLRARTLLTLLLGLVALGVLVAWAGPGHVVDALRSASPGWLALAALAYALFFLIRGWRWRTLLSRSAPDVRLASTTATTAVGWLANSFVPLKGGDVLRGALLARREGLPAGTTAATIAIERVLDMLALALVAALGLALLPRDELPVWTVRALAVAWMLPVLGVILLLALVAFREPALRASARTIGRVGKIGAKLHAFLAQTLQGLHALVRRPRLLAIALPQSLLVTLVQTLIFACLVEAFLPGTSLLVAFGGSALFLLSFVVSVTPGNVGTYEAAFGAVFAALHAASWRDAVAAGILTHVTTTLLVGALGGIAMVALADRRPRRAAARPTAALPGGGRA